MSAFLPLVPIVLIGISLVPALLIFFLRGQAVRSRSIVNIGAAVAKIGVLALVVPLVFEEQIAPEFTMPLVPGIDLSLQVDALSLFFSGLSAVLWLATTIYAIGYLENKPNRSRFFGFFSLCVTATVGLSFSHNLITFLLFYELLSLVTYPLVAHYGTSSALRAARLYLYYALGGGLILLVGVAWLTVLVGPVTFTPGGADAVAELAAEDPATATAIFALLIAGLAVKAALFPLHSWLPRAMVAPAPVSALLHAVAVVKAGVFGITRVVDDVYGVHVAHDLGLLTPLAVVAAVTILYGSVRALVQTDLKKRLAYSTVSQVSYVALGLSIFSEVATTGGLVHLVHQGLAKITLFFCAGLIAERLGVKSIAGLAGLGRRMPLTAAAFTIGAAGMIGLPPTAGFITKWQIASGALDAGADWVLVVLLVSALLNSAYFLPVVWSMWFAEPDESAYDEPEYRVRPRLEAPASLLLPALATAALSLGAGLVAGMPYSPLDIARHIAERIYL
ncbi:MAG: proton-conducting transporter membrane subunit [Mobilicoccus sp.]|nr:proton-conducting transporter membrane subunit [Mobilicoccus sp.]